MDEHTLNDLLECSVCLERLDTSSKVLPCQHTFCRKCLEVIISSHQELRCPECRVLVDIKIDDLPPNVLLMRILEGMRNAATTKTQQQQQQQNKQQCNLQNIETDRLSNNINKLNQQEKSQQHLQQFMQQKKTQQDQQQQHHQQPRRSLLPHAYAMHDFKSTETSDLSFKKGDLVLLKRKIDDNWCVGQANGVEGTFPINYVKVIVPLPSPQCIALYDFKMGPNEEEGCLSFKKGDIIHVFRRVDHNWAEGRIGGTIGIFPIAFVRLNALAEQMLDVNQRQQTTTITTIPTPTISTTNATNVTNTVTNRNSFASNSNSLASSSDSCSTTPNQSQEHTPLHLNQTKTNNAIPSRRSSTEDTSTTSDEMMMLGASGIDVVQLRYREGREKRHSLNALLNDAAVSNATDANVGSKENVARNLLQSNRHSAEILSLPHELSTTSTSISTSTSTTTTTTTCMPPPQQPQQQQARVNVLKSPVIVQQMVPPSLPWGYLALYPYKPRKNDELELKKGCVYIVTERCLDGWFKGKNWQDTLGVFPGNYVTPLRPRDQKQLMHQWKHVPLVSMAPMSNITTTTATTTLAATTNRNNLPILQVPPPDAPPRQLTSVSPSASPPASTTTCASVWTKPLGHTVEAFFSRSNTIHQNNNNNTDKSKEKETVTGNSNTTTATTSSSSSSSTTNAAVSLMKRLTNMKSRSKSPAAHLVSPQETKQQQQQQQQHQAHAIHVRSGSCPSQLLQNMPKDSRINGQQQQQQQQEKLQHHLQQQSANLTSISFGSQRLKGCKERPILPNARQSLDANMFRNTHQQHASSGVQMQHPPKQQQQQQQSQQAQYNFVNQNTSQTLQSINHRKSQSLDANTVLMGNNFNTGAHPLPLPLPLPPPMPATVAQKSYAGRYRCIVPYPPNSEFELELHVDDIIFVNRKPKNGWLKGTCVRTNKTGLFPASFVEPICAQK